MEKVTVMYGAPIPVGHRVERTWYELVEGGLFSKKTRRWEHEPWNQDLDTGIEYVSDRMLGSTGVRHPDTPVSVGEAPSGKVARQLRGIVRACRVVTVTRYSEYGVQTALTIEPAR